MVPYPNGETNGETQGLLSLPDRKVYRLELPELQLSPLTTFPNVVDTCQLKESSGNLLNSEDELEVEYIRDFYIAKAVLSSNPTSPNVCIVMAIHGEQRDLAFCKPGEVMDCHRCPFHDVIYYKGQFYAIKHAGRVLASWGPSLQAAIMVSPSKGDGFDKNYLVES
ncbi:PREDICTED: uncharacterized protein LOC104585984 [Nelumbo nucifera]|uniref:Uncharacterized protein LOC104585984 n=1 Tax=Nelumbo nucifera TaxID=4432 RepID=A0A1U7YN73_NELNU|nr:PREDICTED: uncharacterized protein LOC104585984 [Nelumbo nucifera]